MNIEISGVNKAYFGKEINIYELSEQVKKITEHHAGGKERLNVFLSYSHQDEDIKDALERHLAALRRGGQISSWNDRKILPGEEWDVVIKRKLEEADIILLLISASFINSTYIWENELSRAMERNGNGDVMVIPVFCRACDYSGMPFASLQGLPKDGKPIVSSGRNVDEALKEVAEGIRLVVEDLTK